MSLTNLVLIVLAMTLLFHRAGQKNFPVALATVASFTLLIVTVDRGQSITNTLSSRFPKVCVNKGYCIPSDRQFSSKLDFWVKIMVVTSSKACGYPSYHAQVFFYFFHSHMQHIFLFSYLFYNTDVNQLCEQCTIKAD